MKILPTNCYQRQNYKKVSFEASRTKIKIKTPEFNKKLWRCGLVDIVAVAKKLAVESRAFAGELVTDQKYPYKSGLLSNLTKAAMDNLSTENDYCNKKGVAYLAGLRRDLLDDEIRCGHSYHILDDLYEIASVRYKAKDTIESREIVNSHSV